MKLKKCAIVIPGFLPVPATKGGAVEVLIEELINGNEIEKKFDFDLYNISTSDIKSTNYKHCNIIYLKYNMIDILKGYLYKMILRLQKKDGQCNVGSYIYGLKVKKCLKNKQYDCYLIENNMKIYELLNIKKNVIFHLHNDVFEDDKPKYLCLDIIDNCNNIITVSDYLTNKMKSLKNSAKIKTLYNCVDLNIYSDMNMDKHIKDEIRNQYHMDKNDFIYIYTGRIIEEKGVLELCMAFKEIAKNHKCKLLIVGAANFDKNDKNEFEMKLSKCVEEVKDDIIFTGFIDHNMIPKLLYTADCVVIPSKWEEPFGVVALEAMAMKKPIVSTISGGLTEMLNDSNSIIIDKNNDFIENLVVGMKKMLNDEDFRNRLALNAYNYLISNPSFDKNNYFKNFMNIIEDSGDKDEIKNI